MRRKTVSHCEDDRCQTMMSPSNFFRDRSKKPPPEPFFSPQLVYQGVIRTSVCFLHHYNGFLSSRVYVDNISSSEAGVLFAHGSPHLLRRRVISRAVL